MGKNGRKTSNISEIMNDISKKNRHDQFPIENNILEFEWSENVEKIGTSSVLVLHNTFVRCPRCYDRPTVTPAD